MSKDPYNDISIEKAISQSKPLIEKGCLVYFKFTCTHCGSRQTFDKPNRLYTDGICEECGLTSMITKVGFMVIASGESAVFLQKELSGKIGGLN